MIECNIPIKRSRKLLPLRLGQFYLTPFMKARQEGLTNNLDEVKSLTDSEVLGVLFCCHLVTQMMS